jgi:predicted nucleic acid-binding protein
VILYLDTSSLLKLYIEEPGSQQVATLVASASDVAISLIGYAEARSGLSRGRRSGRLNGESYVQALRQFESRWATTTVLEVLEPLVRRAGDLAEAYALRGFDAIHLASALALKRESDEAVNFSAWDGRLLDAAQAEGLAVAPIDY